MDESSSSSCVSPRYSTFFRSGFQAITRPSVCLPPPPLRSVPNTKKPALGRQQFPPLASIDAAAAVKSGPSPKHDRPLKRCRRWSWWRSVIMEHLKALRCIRMVSIMLDDDEKPLPVIVERKETITPQAPGRTGTNHDRSFLSFDEPLSPLHHSLSLRMSKNPPSTPEPRARPKSWQPPEPRYQSLMSLTLTPSEMELAPPDLPPSPPPLSSLPPPLVRRSISNTCRRDSRSIVPRGRYRDGRGYSAADLDWVQ